MSGNEEADATAGTPDEGKKLTFAERRELERKKKEDKLFDARVANDVLEYQR